MKQHQLTVEGTTFGKCDACGGVWVNVGGGVASHVCTAQSGSIMNGSEAFCGLPQHHDARIIRERNEARDHIAKQDAIIARLTQERDALRTEVARLLEARDGS